MWDLGSLRTKNDREAAERRLIAKLREETWTADDIDMFVSSACYQLRDFARTNVRSRSETASR